jgi:cytochrome c oxidase cbb3-type subunit 3
VAKHDNDGQEQGTTGHEWDGIQEYDNPLPRWWLYSFYACILWSIVYWVVMPAWPLVSDFTKGLLGYSQREVVNTAVAKAESARAAEARSLMAASLAEIEADPNLLAFAMASGEAAFGDNCAPCHGSGAQGFKGYPNLNDDAWLWGGTLDDISQTLKYGIRSQHDSTRYSEMLAFGKQGILDNAQINAVVEYVVTLSGRDADQKLAEIGSEVYQNNCAACHMEDGTGDRTQGAPNLTDAIWLYGGDRATIRETVVNGRMGVMPAWADRLEPATIKSLAVYVHALGGGE